MHHNATREQVRTVTSNGPKSLNFKEFSALYKKLSALVEFTGGRLNQPR